MKKPLSCKNLAAEICVLLLSMGASLPCLALSTDKDQPIEVEADTAELDDIKNISIYTGSVVVVRGSIRMTGDKMTVYHTDDDELDTLIIEGHPATYRQLPDNSTVYDKAEALTMEYHERKNLVVLIDKALVTQEGLRFSGHRIEYDTALSQVKAWSAPKDKAGATDAASGRDRRVKIILKKKKRKSETPGGNSD